MSFRFLPRRALGAAALLTGSLLAALPAAAQCDSLVWADEFTTPGDFGKWLRYEGDGCEVGLCGFGNAEVQVYRPANATIANGHLQIQTRYETSVQNGRTYQYTSAKLLSKLPTGGLQTFRYGRVEASIKLPSGQGAWPAFWMLPQPGNWPATGEIDIMEAKHRNPTAVAGTVHYDAGGHQYTTGTSPNGANLAAGFHTYAVEWSPGRIKWFIDNTNYFTATPATTVGNAWPFDGRDFYLILNSAVGGPGTPFTGGLPPVPADFPTTMEVDYVRVYAGAYQTTISGPAEAPFGQAGLTYSVPAVAGATYAWAVPAGATITSGQGTPSIQVTWGTTSGPVAVTVSAPGCPSHSYALPVQAVLPLPVGPNLALRKPATASSIEGASTPASLAVDGNATTRWSSAFADNQWLTVDLQNTYDLTQVVLRWEAAYATAYQLQTSLDGATWVNRHTTTAGNGGTDNFGISGRARYVRVNCQQRATQYGFSLYELEVYGNLPTGLAAAQSPDVRLFPNPATDGVRLEVSQSVIAAELLDLRGRVVLRQAWPDHPTTADLALSGVAAGAYVLRVQLPDGRTLTRPLLKQ